MLGYKEKVPGIASHSNRQRLGRREPVVPPCVWRDAHRMVAALSPSRVQPCRQRVPTDRMLIFTKTEKIVCADFPGQPKSFRSQAKPFTSHALPLIVVITTQRCSSKYSRAFCILHCVFAVTTRWTLSGIFSAKVG